MRTNLQGGSRAPKAFVRGARSAILPLILMTSWAALSSAQTGGGAVLPPNAQPHNFTLDDMARLLALFDTSGNNPQYYPNTPIQILFADRSKSSFTEVTCPNSLSGFLETGGNSFVISPQSLYFVPLFSVDDSPPVLGVFPIQESESEDYFFGPTEYGGEGFEIIVDGKSTPVGPAFLAGPVETPPLLDGGGTHLIQLGVFLAPLSLGTHTVTIQGQVAGSGVFPTYGIGCDEEDFTYVVKVVSGAKADTRHTATGKKE
jgi:hypothetical protein